ncbi:MAG: ABC transporter permease [Arenicella sp.]
MDWNIVWDNFPRLLDGLFVTVQITSLGVAIGSIIAVVLAMMHISNIAILKWPASTFVLFIRGTPLLVQLFLIYYGSGQFRHELDAIGLWTYFRETYFCAVLALALNTGAYSAEIFIGSIKSVDKKQVEAGRAYGMSGITLYRRVIFPQALRIAWSAYANEIIFIMQATSLVSIITLLDLTGVAGKIISKTFAVYEVYIAVALMYLAFTYTLVFIFSRIEKYLRRHERLR